MKKQFMKRLLAGCIVWMLALIPMTGWATSAAPQNVTIGTLSDSGKPYLTWDAVSGISQYEIYRATSRDGAYTKYYTTTKTSFTNSSAEAGKTYYYKVKAGDTFGKMCYITCDCAKPSVTIATSSASGKPYLSWNAVSGASQYEIYRATSKNGTYTKYYTTSRTSFTNSSAEAGKTYYYKVKAICERSAYGNSAFSAVHSITCDCAKPIVSTKTSAGKPYLSWSAVSGADQYEIWRKTGSDGTYTKQYTTSKTTYTNTSAVAGKTYYYKVRAIQTDNSYATSAYSDAKSVKCTSSGSSATTGQTVYIGETGTKYHRASCGTLKGNGRAISLSDALKSGRTACKVCKP